MSSFEGIWIPIVTPFRNGAVDLDAAQTLAAEFVDRGVHGLVVCGTTGEAATLDDNEQSSLLCAVQEAVGSRCPVVLGIAGSDTRAVVEKVTQFNLYGPAGFLISAPLYVRPSQQGILLHFQAISAATDRPIILYNIPARTGVNIEPATVKALAADPRFVAIKQSNGELTELVDIINHTSLTVLCGDDALLLATLYLGGDGAISAAAHIRPDLYVQLFELMRSGRIEQARAIFNVMLPLIRVLFSEPNPGPVKAALGMQGRIHEELRLPMTPMSRIGKAKLAAALEPVIALPVWPAKIAQTVSETELARLPRASSAAPMYATGGRL